MTHRLWPEPGEVHVRMTTLALNEADLARFEPILSPDERIRADRLFNKQARNRFVAGRGFLRETLARYLDVEPAAIRLGAGEHGKPRLPKGVGQSPLCFNLSHSEDKAILAVADRTELGIDLERIRDDLPFPAMARQFFSCREQAEIFGLPPELQLAAFYRCWTRKEAYLKGCGSGFSQPADTFDVSLLPGHQPALLGHRTSAGEPARWCLMDIDVPDGFYATLAVKDKIPVLRYIPVP